ncbi:MAG: response regulator transcription factor [Lacibacter sp.]|nr:response regulator transcription factor [Lacibacter sp.]
MVNASEALPLRLLLLDDHVIFLQGLSELLIKVFPLFDIKTSSSTEKARRELETDQYNILLSDIMIPGSNVRELIIHCKKKHPSLKIVILSSIQEMPIIKEFLELGVDGYLTKAVSAIEIRMAFEKILNDEKYISTDISSKLANNLFEDARSPLTKKELEVLRMVAAGSTVIKTSEQLLISKATVMAHRRSIMSKLDLHSAAELVKYAYENKLV